MAIQVDLEREFVPAINKIMAKLKDLEKEIGLVKSNTEFMIKSFDKVIKKVR